VEVDRGDGGPDRLGTRLPNDPTERFRVFYETEYPNVYAFVLRRLLGSHEDALDVTSEVFATAWRRRDRLPPPPEDRLWIYGVARRVLSRHRRSLFRRSMLQLRLQSHVAVDDRLEANDQAVDDVRAAIARLRASDRDVLALVLWEQLSHVEAGKVLGCSANAVAIRVHRARERLRRELLKSGHDLDDAAASRGRKAT
jgi:RNA polymerase sigma-70 factor, ECF subfamily